MKVCLLYTWPVSLPIGIQYNILWHSYVNIVVYDQINDLVQENKIAKSKELYVCKHVYVMNLGHMFAEIQKYFAV